jgi:hypothetical protein
VPVGQRRLPVGVRILALGGPAAGRPRPHPGERATSGRAVGSGQGGRHGFAQGRIAQERDDTAKGRGVPGWLDLDADRFQGTVRQLPNREDIALPIQEQLIVELYSK